MPTCVAGSRGSFMRCDLGPMAAKGVSPARVIRPMPEPAAHPEDAGEGPPTAGQMTDETADAKRLFDHERWAEAAAANRRVVDGDTGDDEGNRQIAEYHLAIC